MFGRTVALRGDYTGFRDASIRYRLRFCDDGIYFYLAERADDDYVLWQLAHRGRWVVTAGSHPRSGTTTSVLQLQPEYLDVGPSDCEAVPMLRERALPTDRLEKYLIAAADTGHRRPGETGPKTYYCTVPDPRGGLAETSWHMESA